MIPPLVDGPLQRQMLLAKLVYEMENRPDFGDEYEEDPDGEIQMWFSRVKALMRKVGLSEGVNFAFATSSSKTYWDSNVKQAQSCVRDAIETLKLEFDLHPEANIGEVYDAGETYTFFQDLTKIVSEASSEILVVDQFFDSPTFAQVFPASIRVPIRVLCNRNVTAVQETSAKFSSEAGVSCEVRASNDLHDRLMIVDRDHCWLVGASLKDGGKKPTYIIPLAPDLARKKLEIYERIWADSRD